MSEKIVINQKQVMQGIIFYNLFLHLLQVQQIICMSKSMKFKPSFFFSRGDAGGLSREYVLRIPSVS